MNKKINFMTGLPRSGSTLLTALLNQNPNIYSSPQSDLLQLTYLLNSNITNLECYQSGVLTTGSRNTVKKLWELYYTDIKKPMIVDKHRNWCTPYNYQLLNTINPNAKIIVTVRPILEILTSFILLARKYPGTNWIDKELKEKDFFSFNYRDLDDVRCDYLMRPWGDIDTSLLSLSKVTNNPNKFKIVKYNELVTNTKNVLNDVSTFLEIPEFNYSFNKINSVDNLDDMRVYGVPSLHSVRKEISRISPKPEEVLSDYVISKYGNLLNFLNF